MCSCHLVQLSNFLPNCDNMIVAFSTIDIGMICQEMASAERHIAELREMIGQPEVTREIFTYFTIPEAARNPSIPVPVTPRPI